jgi:hypothetical protein
MEKADGELDILCDKAEKKFNNFVKDTETTLKDKDYKMILELFCYQEIENHFDEEMNSMVDGTEKRHP